MFILLVVQIMMVLIHKFNIYITVVVMVFGDKLKEHLLLALTLTMDLFALIIMVEKILLPCNILLFSLVKFKWLKVLNAIHNGVLILMRYMTELQLLIKMESKYHRVT